MRLEPAAAELAAGFDRIREELQVPDAFPPDAEAEAQAATVPPAGTGRADRRDLELVTIDPPGSRDLDQALHIARHGDGHRVSYAIADVAARNERRDKDSVEDILQESYNRIPDCFVETLVE